MLVMRHPETWLDHADPWSPAEAADLLQSLRGRQAVGDYACLDVGDGRWLVQSGHAEVALLVDDIGRVMLMERVCRRFGLEQPRPAQAWWALPALMPSLA